MNLENDDLEKIILKNAILHEGKADLKTIVNKLLGNHPELRGNVGELMKDLKPAIERINSLSLDQQVELVRGKYPDIIETKKPTEEKRLPDLKNVRGRVVMRLAPSPSGPLHLGHSRMCILNDEYVKRYGGELILRIEDTNPNNIYKPAYEMIREDAEWLGVNVTQYLIQSERMELYYERARELIKMQYAYMCSCESEDFKKKLIKSEACPHRDLSVNESMELFNKIVKEGPTGFPPVLVIKTDLKHPNPAIRDWIAFRYIKEKHPHTGSKYHFYPLMNFSVAIDDHELGLTNIIRGMDHLNNTERQKYIFKYFNWNLPEYFHYGLINIADTILSTTTMRKGIQSGEFVGWDDVRLATLRALKSRGYQPGTFRKYWIDSGLNDVNSEFSWEIFNSINKQFIDKIADRYFFVSDPVTIKVESSPETDVRIPLYPRDDSRGFRIHKIGSNPKLVVERKDLESIADGVEIRLKDLYNIKKENGRFIYTGTENKGDRKKIIHWLQEDSPNFKVVMPDASEFRGKIERNGLNANGIIQFERFGFVNKKSVEFGLFLHK